MPSGATFDLAMIDGSTIAARTFSASTAAP
jgi:hypothetical protein